MSDDRSRRAGRNIIVSLLGQAVTLICGLILPRVLLRAFGSELYGATASISQFLAYIALLEGGISGVARAALYKPLAYNDMTTASAIINQIKRFFRTIGYIFLAYVLILACTFKYISNIEILDWFTTFLLVVIISASSFAQYFIGVSYSVFLQASQRTYITVGISTVATILNTALVVLLVQLKCNIIVVKLVSGCVFALRPVAMWLYVKKNFQLEKNSESKENLLKQKWDALGQHIAYFLHSNTDIVVLTIWLDLKVVAVYSVYNMVISHIQNIVTSFATGMEAVFGDMLAKKESKQLHATFDSYEALVSVIGIILYATTAVLIVPFVRIYTAGIQDVNYIQPVFAIILLLSALLFCLRKPYHSIVMAAGHFKQTRIAAYGEAVINIVLSVLLVGKFGLTGVAVGTVISSAFRFGYYIIYLSKHIFERKMGKAFKRMAVNSVALVLCFVLGSIVRDLLSQDNYLLWAISGLAVTAVVIAITVGTNAVFYRNEMHFVFSKILRKRSRGG